MEELFKNSVIKGLVYSAFDKFGPQPIYAFPEEISDEESQLMRQKDIIKFTRQDYTRISIKSLSMIIGDRDFKDFKEDLLNLPYYGILPYPDFNLTSLTFYHFIKTNFSEKLIISAFSILVEENQRSFLYNNLVKLKPLITGFFYKFDKEIENGYKERSKIEPLFHEFLLKLIEIEKKPFAPITSKRKMKILFAGLDDSGKTSFLLNIDKIHPGKQIELVKSAVIESFSDFFTTSKNKEKIIKFVEEQLESASPKTKKIAKDFLNRFTEK